MPCVREVGAGLVSVRRPTHLPAVVKTCRVDGCERASRARGFCNAHWKRWKLHGDPLVHIPIRVPQPTVCVVEHCDKRPQARGLCHNHYYAWGKYGDPLVSTFSSPGRLSRGHVTPAGYVVAQMHPDDPFAAMGSAKPGKNTLRIAVHRYVMARHLGRCLLQGETVHHINGDRTDNRLENLQLRQGNHGMGAVFRCCDCGSENVEATPLAEAS